MELTIDGETKVYRKGDEYYIQSELNTQQGLEADAEQLTSSVKKTGTNQKTPRNTINSSTSNSSYCK